MVHELKIAVDKCAAIQLIYGSNKPAIYGFKTGAGRWEEVVGFRLVLRWLEGSAGLVGWLQAVYSVLNQLS